MPLYEFTCKACDNSFEVLVRGSETPACPKCQSADLERRFSTFAARSSSGGATRPAPVDSCGTCGSLTPGACGPNYEVSKSV